MKDLNVFFEREGIGFFGCVPYDDAFLLREKYLADRYDGPRRSLWAFAVPYYYPDEARNISAYAVPRDYHLYFEELFSRMYAAFPDVKMRGFADTSPFDERALAQVCGIGTRGDNGLIINPVYGSYVFIGSIISDAEPVTVENKTDGRTCTHCGACRRACPSPELCLSRITQTKGQLSPEHIALIKEQGSAWGCDVCQTVCPANFDPVPTPIDFFRQERVSFLTSEYIYNISDETFSSRAYAWKGKNCILRNLEIIEK